MQRVSIIGTGYVGLVSAVCFADKGFKVIASTRNREKADMINSGVPPFFEAGLDEALKKALSKGNLRCVVSRDEPVLGSDISFITVGTPSRPDGSIDLSFIREAAAEIGDALRRKDDYHLVVVKSTVVPGTTQNVVKPTIEQHSDKKTGTDFGLCMNPEFLREGSAIRDTLRPDRTIIGEYDKKSGDILRDLYSGFYGDNPPPTITTNLPTAELIKYASNAFLATKVSFINTIANICEKIPGADVTVVAKGIGLDRRIGPLFLNAGLGYGGSCFPKDVKALIAFSKSLDCDPALIRAAEDVNDAQPYRAIETVKRVLGDLRGRRVAVLGLAFKPGTDDMREASSIKVVNALLQEGAEVAAYDPAAIKNAKKIFGERVNYAESSLNCLKNAECCIIVTEWKEFKELQPEDFVTRMKRPLLIDGRRIYDPKKFGERLDYVAVGLGREY